MTELVEAPEAPIPLTGNELLPIRRSDSDAGLYRTTTGDIARLISNLNFVGITQAGYDALSPPNPDTIYFIVG